MREIKFRAWDNDKKCFILPENLVYRLDGYLFDREFDVELHNIELMQFTGLLDKNGKEIYEGDIVKGYGYEVRNGYQIRPERIFIINDFIKDTYRLLCITEGTGETVEIIGNIYENPDLL